ncbi:MAG: polymer-forming cytoskeletal protein [candidate division Zixibacteria bacterium]|nr:polymer-forming cytoskeletal protein [candidate division Zixibacteria bacterium]
MRHASFVIHGILSLCVLALSGAAPLSAQEPDFADTIFNEVLLSDEGITAIDSAGNEWHYDFERQLFVRGIRERGAETSVDVPDMKREDLPVEERCTVERQVKPLEKRSVTIGFDEYVDGNILAWGRVTVKGWVRGNVKSMQKRVLVTETGQVDGNIEAPEIVVKDGGVVLGHLVEEGSIIDIEDFTPAFSPNGIIVVVSLTVFLMFLSFLIVALMPKQIDNCQTCCQHNPVKTYLLGFLFVFLLPVVMAVLTITIIGVIAVPFVPLLYIFAMILGIVSFGNRIGGRIFGKYLGGRRHMSVQAMLGILVLMALWLAVAVLMGAADATSQGLGIALLVISILIWTVPVLSGVGAALLTRFGFRKHLPWSERQRQKEEPAAPTPAPPPIPEGNNIIPPIEEPRLGGFRADRGYRRPHPDLRSPLPPPPLPPETNDDDSA